MEVPHYLKKVTFTYTVRTTVFKGNSVTTDSISGELLVPNYMDPEWNVVCYLLAYPLKNNDPTLNKELLSLSLDCFTVTDDKIIPDNKENWEYEEPEEVIPPVGDAELDIEYKDDLD